MPNYSFETLSDVDFEELVRDLLQAELKIRLESFAAGRDGGIDIRYSPSTDAELIVQCKHYVRSGYPRLKRNLETEESAKIQALRPTRYILATSVPMTPHRKRDLATVLEPYCHSPADIYGREDLNNLLGMHEAIEQQHHKLWLSSEAVLRRVLQNRSFVQAEIEYEVMRRRVCLYVQTPAYTEALEILERLNYCILSGIPGIGKTMLANMLVLRLLDAGYELIVARGSVDEALERYETGKPQVIYYDDFLGRTSLGDRLGKNEDQSLLRLLEAVRRSKNKKMVLTTREYILAQARERHELLNRPEIDVAKCMVVLVDYSRYAKARILYNHLYFCDVPRECIASILLEQAYKRIIDHRNYNPRVIEWMTGTPTTRGVPAEQYAEAFVTSLDDPSEVWRHAFENQISAGARRLIVLLATIPETAGLDELEVLWLAGIEVQGGSPGDAHLQFLRALREVDGSLTTAETRDLKTGITFHNPSIRDFMHRELGRNKRLCHELLESAMFFEQVERLLRISPSGKLDRQPVNPIGELPALCDVVERTLAVKSPCLHRLKTKSGIQMLMRAPTDLGRRLSKVAGWATTLNRADLMRMICARASQLLDGGQLNSCGPAQLTNLVGFLVAWSWAPADRPTALIDSLVRHNDEYLDDTPSVDDWVEWGRFLEEFSGEIDAGNEDDLKVRVRSFAQNKTEEIIAYADDSGEIEWRAHQLRELGEAWEVDLKNLVIELEEAASERAADGYDDGDLRDGGFSRPSNATPIGGIEEMFDSLRHSEQ